MAQNQGRCTNFRDALATSGARVVSWLALTEPISSSLDTFLHIFRLFIHIMVWQNILNITDVRNDITDDAHTCGA
jgi:hypothetical protein